MAAHEGINWDQFDDTLETAHMPYIQGTPAEGDIEQWSHGTTKWPKKYLREVQDRHSEAYVGFQDHLKTEVNLPDQVQVTHRGDVPQGAKIRSGSIYPNWTGNNPNKEEFGIHHYGQTNKLHIYLVPRQHIIGVGHTGEGEVFFDEGSKKPAPPAPGLGRRGKTQARKNLKGFK
jgi:hypothetical protein